MTMTADELNALKAMVLCIPPPKAVCPDLLIGVKSMAYVMRYNHFPH